MCFFATLATIISFLIFANILNSKIIQASIGSYTLNIYPENKLLWNFIKHLFIITQIISSLLISKYLFYKLNPPKNHTDSNKSTKQQIKSSNLNLLIGTDINNNPIILPENGLYQNILITGSIGSRKNQ